VFAFDDVLAIHILNAVRYYGLRVPDDISILGFDNIVMAGHSNPPLTTVDVPKRRIGRLMVNLLAALQKKPHETLGHTIIEGSVVVRASTGRAPF
jgi:LacI family transcriptional regulator